MIKLSRLAKAAVLALVASITAAGIATAAPTPTPRLPRPTGSLPVGQDTLHLVDRSRHDPYVPEAATRELMVSLFYPARPHTGTPARYATLAEVRLLLAAYDMQDLVSAQAFSATTTNSRLGALPANGRYPLVLLSPGINSPRYLLTSLAEDLASHGYVVAAIDHAYESAGTLFPGGRMLTCIACEKEQTAEDRERATVTRGIDASFVVDQLTGHRPAWRYAWVIDKNRIGMGGHSRGGASAVSAMAADPRIQAGVNLDGAFHDRGPTTGLGRPFLMIGTDDDVHRPGGRDHTWDETWVRLTGWKRWLTITGTDHLSFCDAEVVLSQLGVPGPALPATRAMRIIRDYTTAFFDLHLRHIPQPILAGPTPANPEVRFNNP